MKTLMMALLVSFFAIQLSAQDIANHSQKQFYADLVSKAATLNGDWGLLGGIRAGYNINDNVSIGLIAHGLIPNKLEKSYINRKGRDEMHLGYGGVEASYKYDLSDRFYLAGIMMIGAGRVDYENLGGNDYFFIAEPGASVNYRVIDWFGLGYSVNYRFASGVKYADFTNASFSGWATTLDFKFNFDLY